MAKAVPIRHLGLGQTSELFIRLFKLSRELKVLDKFDVRLSSYVRLNELRSSNTFYPNALDGDRLRDKRRSSLATN